MYQQAAEATKSTDSRKWPNGCVPATRSQTVLGEIKLNTKGDLIDPKYVWYTFKDGKYFEDPSIK